MLRRCRNGQLAGLVGFSDARGYVTSRAVVHWCPLEPDNFPYEGAPAPAGVHRWVLVGKMLLAHADPASRPAKLRAPGTRRYDAGAAANHALA
jgi:hypothetical protein